MIEDADKVSSVSHFPDPDLHTQQVHGRVIKSQACGPQMFQRMSQPHNLGHLGVGNMFTP